MSTLSISTPGISTPSISTPGLSSPRPGTPRVSSTSDVDARFAALVRSAAPAQRSAPSPAAFESVFDLDYGQSAVAPVSVLRTRQASRRIRVAAKPQPVARRVRLTRRGRVVALVGFVAVALAVMTAMGGWATATLSGGTPAPVRVVEVAPGDTLYDIAADLAKPGEIREMVLRIQELNSLPGAQIAEGQKLAVPRG